MGCDASTEQSASWRAQYAYDFRPNETRHKDSHQAGINSTDDVMKSLYRANALRGNANADLTKGSTVENITSSSRARLVTEREFQDIQRLQSNTKVSAAITDPSLADKQLRTGIVFAEVKEGKSKDENTNPGQTGRVSDQSPHPSSRNLSGRGNSVRGPNSARKSDRLSSRRLADKKTEDEHEEQDAQNKNATTPGTNHPILQKAPSPLISSSNTAKTNETALTMTAVSKHNTAQSCWVVVQGNVYDVTGFLTQHPGGSTAILGMAGRDATNTVFTVHSNPTLVMNSMTARSQSSTGGIKLLGPLVVDR